jgi:hypothetical protein
MKLHAEFIRICAPLKRQVQQLDVRSRLDFQRLLIDSIDELKRREYKLTGVSKYYKEDGRWQVDSFWTREATQNGVAINFVCKLVVSLKGDFRVDFDFDFWFEFPVVHESVRTRLHDFFAGRLSERVAEIMKAETDRIWRKVEDVIQTQLAHEFPEGWGKHGLDKRAGRREAKRVYHALGFTIARTGEFSEFLSSLKEVDEKALGIAEKIKGDVEKIAAGALEELVPPPLESQMERLLTSAVWGRRQGVFEYQLHRFTHENLVTSSSEISKTLRRLELWGHVTRRNPPKAVKSELEELGVYRFHGFYIPGPVKLSQTKQANSRKGIGLEPLPLQKVPNFLRAPEHLVNRAIVRMLRKGVLRKRVVVNHLGRRVTECRVLRRSRSLSRLELEIVNVITMHRRKQLELLDRMKTSLGHPKA